MATHSSILVWRILWTEEPGGLQSMGSRSRGAPLASTVPSVSHSRRRINPSTLRLPTQILCASYSRAGSRTFHWLTVSFPVLLHLLTVTS